MGILYVDHRLSFTPAVRPFCGSLILPRGPGRDSGATLKSARAPGPALARPRFVIEHAAALALVESGNLGEAVIRIIRSVCETLDWACGALWAFDAQRDALVCAETWGIALPEVQVFLEATRQMRQAEEPGGLVRRAWLEAKPIWIEDVTQDKSLRRAQDARKAGLHCAFAFPIKDGDRVIGVMEFFGREALPPDRELLESSVFIDKGISQFMQRKQVEDDLLRLRAVMDAAPDLFFVVDPQTLRFLYVNEIACKVQGLTREEYLQLSPWKASGITREELVTIYDAVIAKPAEAVTSETFGRALDGRRGWFETQRRALHVDGRWLIVIGSREITQRKLAEQSALRLGRMYAALSATNEAIMHSKSPEDLFGRVCDAAVHGGKFMTAAVLVPDTDTAWTKVVAVSGDGENALRKARISVDEATAVGRGLVGTAFRTLTPCVSNDFLKDERTAPWHAVAKQAGMKAGAAIPLMRNGRAIGILQLYSSQKNAFDEEIVKLLERMVENITFALHNFEREAERKSAEEHVQYLATHDALTGLPNRSMFGQLIGMEIESARRYQRKFAVAFIDLDRFKDVNDTLGHDAGDTLLKEMSARFKAALRMSDIVARFGGDEFVILMREVSDVAQVAAIAGKVLAAAVNPVTVAGQECGVTASVGIALYPEDAADEQSLMKNADMAMYAAKEKGKNNFQFYATNMRSR
ncbi:diguanylate cyclase domain-containing protein [Rhodoferax sp. UBA5149]|uniref:diguanylate cyclase domain-containing protein n=1 Tax=Rhodoferax sp. UBA5149 TaxID=1947379 RepID=UPI0025D80214|nr:diguanylate cyclase [Rhodoferax sp. UBA5149]